MRLIILLVATTVLAACKKETTEAPSFSEAVYKVTFTGQWSSPKHGVPPSAHFTPIIGMVHNDGTFMYRPGSLASAGVEAVAEDGNAFPLIREVDSLIALKKAVSNPIYFVTPISGSSTITIYLNDRYPLFSCMSMLAPTPDWFLGVNSVNLKQGASGWASDTTIQVYAYDAGTEERDIFNQDNAPTVPQQPVAALTTANASVLANGNTSIAPVATLRFIRQ